MPNQATNIKNAKSIKNSRKWPLMSEFTLNWYDFVRIQSIEKAQHANLPEIQELVRQIQEFEKKYLQDSKYDKFPKYPNIVLDIAQYKTDEHVLRLKSHAIPDNLISSIEVQYFALILLLTLLLSEDYVNTPGIGLSSIQVGVPYAMFWAYVSKLNRWELFINPKISVYDNTFVAKKEGCLSILGVNVVVQRPKAVKIKYKNAGGVLNKVILKNFDARVVQHEFDHLQGKLIVDYK